MKRQLSDEFIVDDDDVSNEDNSYDGDGSEETPESTPKSNEDDDDDSVPPRKRKREADDKSKKSKKDVKPKPKPKENEKEKETETETETGGDGFEKNSQGEIYVDLPGNRRLTLREFKGRPLIDIREYYLEKSSGDMKPGKKGISLSVEQWRKITDVRDRVDAWIQKE